MPNFDKKNVWKNNIVPPIIFGWKDILAEWSDSLMIPHQVQVVLDNLQAASDWSFEYAIPLDHFLRYLNYEKEAILWFIYEIIAMRWMWGESRLDFVSYLIQHRSDLVNVDDMFCDFPGMTKGKYLTLRKFLTDHLTEEELNYVNMPPPKVSEKKGKHMFDPLPTTSNAASSYEMKDEASEPKNIFAQTNEQWNFFADLPPLVPAEPRPVVVVKKAKEAKVAKAKEQKYSAVLFRFCRKPSDTDEDEDELMWLYKTDEDTYKIIYQDRQNPKQTKQTVSDMDRIGVRRYLSAMFRMMHIDTDPYANIQIQFPHMPMVLVKPKMSAEDRDIVYDAMDLTFDNWPTHVV